MTLSLNLPLPVANGAGAAVDVSALGAPLTLTCVGQLAGANIAIEVSNDGGATWQPMIAWQNVGGERVVPAAIQWMRTNVSGRGSKPWLVFSADLDVAGPGTGTSVVSLPMPVGNGAGAAVDTSSLEQLCTFVCTGSFAGCSIAIEISEDNVGWTPLLAFAGIGGVISKVVNASWMRVNVSGRTTAPFSGLMAVGSSALGSASAGVVFQDEGLDVVTSTTVNFVGAGVTVTDVGGVATVTIAGGGTGQAAGTTGAGTGPSPLKTVFGSFLPSAGSQYFDDLFTEANITKAMDAGGVTAIQRYDNPPDVGGERILVQAADGTWATIVFGQANGASLGGGYGLYAPGSYTSAAWEWRMKSNEGGPQAGDDWTELVGMAQVDNPTATHAQVKGFYFHLNFATYGNNHWQCVLSDGVGGTTVVDTGIAADFAWHRFTITWDLATTTLKYYIAGVLVGTIDSSVVGIQVGSPMISVGNTEVGSSDQRDVQADYFYGDVAIAR